MGRILARPGTTEATTWPAGLKVEYERLADDPFGGKVYKVYVDDVAVGQVEQRQSSRGRGGAWAAAGWGWSPSFLAPRERSPRGRERSRAKATANLVNSYVERTLNARH